MNLLLFLPLGLAAGWLAGLITKGSGSGWLGNLLAGSLGASLANRLLEGVGFTADGWPVQLLAATLGAVLVLVTLAFCATPPPPAESRSALRQDLRSRPPS